MKILQIHLCNLNSLAGQWSIDLTSQEYDTDGIFAITGPTGAGKTTILDAICLALYGKTPRLEKVNKGSNEIMTRQTGECWAEVEFATAKGRFRCHWAQHRSRKSTEGDLQPSRHEIVDGDSGKVIESRKRQVEQKVIEVTGMSYEQFTRSILLAQGEFNTFLNARPDERAPILEQITGTEIYSRISQKVHEIRARHQTALDKLQAECDGFMPLLPEEVATIEQRRQELTEGGRTMETEISKLRSLLDWLQSQEQFKLEIANLEQQLKQATLEWQQLSGQRTLLERAEHAEKLRPTLEQLLTTRNLQERESRDHAQTCSDLNQLEEALKGARTEQQQLEKTLTATTADDIEFGQLLRKVRGLDKEISLIGKQHGDYHNELETISKQRNEVLSRHRSITEQLAKLEKDQAALSAYFTQHKQDKRLLSELSGIQQYSAGYLELAASCNKLEQELKATSSRLLTATKQVETDEVKFNKLASQLTGLQKENETVHDKLAKLFSQNRLANLEELLQRESELRETSRLLEQLHEHSQQLTTELEKTNTLTVQLNDQGKELAELKAQVTTTERELGLCTKSVQQQERVLRLATKVKNLEEERDKLRDGSPCPLCGATKHPYCSSAKPPEMDREEQLLAREQAQLAKVQQHLTKITNSVSACQARIEQLQKRLAESHDLIKTRQAQRDQLAGALEVSVGPELLHDLEERRRRLDSSLVQLKELRNQCLKLKSDADQVHTRLESVNRETSEAERSLQKTRNMQENLTSQQDQLRQSLKEHNASLAQQSATLQTMLQPYLTTELENNQLQATLPQILPDLVTRKNTWQEAESREQELALSSQRLNTTKTSLEAQSTTLEATLSHGKKRFEALGVSLKTLTTERQALFGDKDTDLVEQQRLEQQAQLRQQFESLTRRCEQLAREQARLTERRTSLQSRLDERRADLNRQTDLFEGELQNAGFTDEGDYLAARLSPEKLSEIRELLDGKTRELEKHQHLLLNTRVKLENEQQKNLTELPAAELTAQLSELGDKQKALAEESGALNQQLKNNAQLQKRHQLKLEQLTQQGATVEHWSQLHDLIGSADGKKFRNFAQGLTFELMIHHANVSLQQMSDRYLLVHNPHQPLELHVIDNYQAGDIRSTKNLSGGESFIVSMALALGLSSMASNTVQVDSLFLDEGFGTLDEEALQTALDTLSSLHQSGKLIGIISHISGLQERITTRIQVNKGLGGLSTLTGPGVSACQ